MRLLRFVAYWLAGMAVVLILAAGLRIRLVPVCSAPSPPVQRGRAVISDQPSVETGIALGAARPTEVGPHGLRLQSGPGVGAVVGGQRTVDGLERSSTEPG